MLDKTQWIAQLENYLDQKTNETDQLSDVAKLAPIVVRNPEQFMVVKDGFHDDVVARDAIRAIDPAVYRASDLQIQAKPEWTITSRQAYYQVKPVPMLDDPVQVGNFLLWPDPEREYIDIKLPPHWVDQFVAKEPPMSKFPADRVIPRLIDQPMLAPIVDRITVSPGLTRLQTIAPIAENFRAVKIPTRRVFFASTVPSRKEVKLTIRRATKNNTIQITGGTAILTVSVYSSENPELLEQFRSIWTDALVGAGYGSRIWKFLPVSMPRLQAVLEIDAALLQNPVRTIINANTSTATFVIELSALGAQVWKNALEQQQAYAIPGITSFTVKYFTQYSDRIDIQQRKLSATLGSLLSNCGTEIMEVFEPSLTVDTKLIVQGNAIIDQVELSWTPNTADAPINRSFDSSGGLLIAPITTQNLNQAKVDWKATVKFKMAGWTMISPAGKLSAQTSLVDIVKPSSWIQEYTLITLQMASENQISTDPTAFSNLETEATFTFSAPYLQNGVPLTTTFQPNKTITTVPFPRVPEQTPTQVGLVITTRSRINNQVLNSTVRILQNGENLICAKVFSNGQVEIFTTQDPTPEKSSESDALALLTQIEQD